MRATVSFTAKAERRPKSREEAYTTEYLLLNLPMNYAERAERRPEDSARLTKLNIPTRKNYVEIYNEADLVEAYQARNHRYEG